jgi:transposase
VIVHEPGACAGCGAALAADGPPARMIRRQVFDIPQIAVRVVEHRLLSRRCSCGTLTRAAEPAGVTAPVSYGPHAAAIAIYLVLGQHLPVARIAALLAELFGTPIATGTVAAWTSRTAAGLAPFTAAVVAGLARAELVHADETGLRVAGRGHWLHVASSALFTALVCHPKRGKEGIDAAGVLPHFTGTLVHDAFAPYARYPAARHALCNAHLLRELIAVVDHHTAQPPAGADTPAGWCWAQQVIDALLELKAITDTGALPDPGVLAAHRRLIVSAALIGAAAEAARRGDRPPAPRPGPPPPPAPRRVPALRHRPAGAVRQQRRRARHPDGQDQAEGVRVPAHPGRRPGLHRDALLPVDRGQARPSTLRRPSPNSPAETSGSQRQAEQSPPSMLCIRAGGAVGVQQVPWQY